MFKYVSVCILFLQQYVHIMEQPITAVTSFTLKIAQKNVFVIALVTFDVRASHVPTLLLLRRWCSAQMSWIRHGYCTENLTHRRFSVFVGRVPAFSLVSFLFCFVFVSALTLHVPRRLYFGIISQVILYSVCSLVNKLKQHFI